MKKKFKHLIWALPVLFIAFNLTSCLTLTPSNSMEVISHRGAGGLAPENTLVGVETAVSMGIQKIEIDVRRTRDSVIILMHDASLNRTTNGKGKVVEVDWTYIETLAIENEFDAVFDNQKVAKFSTVLDKISGTSTQLIVEIKDPKEYPGIEEDLLEIMAQHDARNNVIFTSFNQSILAKLRSLDPNIPIGVLSLFPKRPKASLGKIDFMAVHSSSVFITPWKVKKMISLDIPVWVWTVNKPAKADRLAKRGISGVITDRPDIVNRD